MTGYSRVLMFVFSLALWIVDTCSGSNLKIHVNALEEIQNKLLDMGFVKDTNYENILIAPEGWNKSRQLSLFPEEPLFAVLDGNNSTRFLIYCSNGYFATYCIPYVEQSDVISLDYVVAEAAKHVDEKETERTLIREEILADRSEVWDAETHSYTLAYCKPLANYFARGYSAENIKCAYHGFFSTQEILQKVEIYFRYSLCDFLGLDCIIGKIVETNRSMLTEKYKLTDGFENEFWYINWTEVSNDRKAEWTRLNEP